MSMAFYQYVEFLLKERKSLEDKLETMDKAELIRFGRQLLATYEQSLRGFEQWFTDFTVMERMDPEMVRDIAKNLIRVGFALLQYDIDVTRTWNKIEEALKKRKEEEDLKKKTAHTIV